ncbi:helix-turn-helix domain-containing protein [Actinomadura barringtoniae]|uniref:Helix-turn-helix domain-containing protein n=1 Tax=Actinomadura barringtoniae TaxID=1427535 RepID=A0A939PMK0_9ACTN|nr:helix-turn-helix domain-containing protein [Actinomadura barringtoniae]MBO2451894.1 helix-turn-helix domain-containing protein [Actinomadura barringtoniae]
MDTTSEAAIREKTTERLEKAMGTFGTAALASMEEQLPWFRRMPADQRSWIGLVAQAGIAAFVEWFKSAEESRPAIAGEVFGTAPRELLRSIKLKHTIDMVRVIIDVVETRLDELAAPGGEAQLREAILRYTRDVAFGAAQVYAQAAETRAAWDARLEALVVNAVLRGEVDDGMHSWAAALGWTSKPVVVIAGMTPEDEEPEVTIDQMQLAARRARVDVLAGVQGHRVIVIVGGAEDQLEAARPIAAKLGPGPVVIGPPVDDLYDSTVSAQAALAGLKAAAGWPDAPRPVLASELLPERALDGDADARRYLVDQVFEPMCAAGAPLLDTLTTYLEQGSSLEATARLLFVHPNTVRYRLRRVAELTGLSPTDGRNAFTLRIALVLGRFGARPARV